MQIASIATLRAPPPRCSSPSPLRHRPPRSRKAPTISGRSRRGWKCPEWRHPSRRRSSRSRARKNGKDDESIPAEAIARSSTASARATSTPTRWRAPAAIPPLWKARLFSARAPTRSKMQNDDDERRNESMRMTYWASAAWQLHGARRKIAVSPPSSRDCGPLFRCVARLVGGLEQRRRRVDRRVERGHSHAAGDGKPLRLVEKACASTAARMRSASSERGLAAGIGRRSANSSPP